GQLTESRQVMSAAGGLRNRYAAADSSPGTSSKRSYVTAVGRQRVVVWSQARKPVLFDTDGRRVAELDVAPASPDSLAWGRNVVTFSQIDRIAFRSDDGTVSLWNGENGARIALSSDIGGSREISLVRDDATEARFAITIQDGSVIIIDALSGRIVGRY